MTDDISNATVLAVDDEEAYLDAYREWLADVAELRTAIDGEDALDKLDRSIDVVLLDRRMPNLTGRAVLERIRNRGIDCRVAMVTAVEPDLEVIDMDFDDYLVKPISESEVRSLVDTLVARRSLDERVQECFSLASKKAALEGAMSESELEATGEYRDLVSSLSTAEAEASESLDRLIDDGAIVGAYDDIGTRG